MRKFFVIIILLLVPFALNAQGRTDEKRKIEYSLAVAPVLVFDMPNHTYADPYTPDFYDKEYGFNLEFDTRAVINKYLYAGGEFSICTFYLTGAIMPAFQFNFAPSIKGLLPLSEQCSLFANMSLGATSTMMICWGFYIHGGIGVEINRFALSFGYRGYANRAMNIDDRKMGLANAIYAQLGIRLGKM